MTPAEKAIVHASNRRSSDDVHSTKDAPMPVAAPAPRLIANAACLCEPEAASRVSVMASSSSSVTTAHATSAS